MSQQVPRSTPFTWSAARTKAAILLAEDRLSDEEIAAQVGVSRRGMAKWKCVPEFQARIQQHRDELDRAVSRYSIAKPRERIRVLDRQQTKLLDLQEARAADYAGRVPGGETGMMIPQVKIGGGGPDGPMVVTEWVRDDISPEIRALQKQAAQELGQWSEKSTITHAGGIRREIVVVGAGEGATGDVSDAAVFGSIEAEITSLLDAADEDDA